VASKDLVKVEEYAVMQVGSENLLETIQANLGGQSISEFDLDRVTIPSGGGGAWTVPSLEGEQVTPTLQGVVVYWKDTRSFWRESFESAGGGSPPDCSSPDAEYAQGDPTPIGEDAPRTPATPDGLWICAQCPNAQFGSDPREGSNAQACKLGRQLFLLPPDGLLPIVVSLPPTSVQEANKYFLRLAQRGKPYYTVVTSIGLEKATSGGNIKYSKAQFSMAAALEGEQADRVRAVAEAMRPAFERSTIQTAAEMGATA
jgi:hypothetical protein